MRAPERRGHSIFNVGVVSAAQDGEGPRMCSSYLGDFEQLRDPSVRAGLAFLLGMTKGGLRGTCSDVNLPE